jgi:D-alanyl-D-alanine carboxypeptidase
MFKPRCISLLTVAVLALTTPALNAPASAQGLYLQPKYAAILLDAATGEILYARQADALRYPASITKVLTLYVAFEAIARGQLRLDEPIFISKFAAAHPSKLGLKAGSQIRVQDAINVIATRSANDIAVALAEALSGSEAAFAERMTITAKRLGMTSSMFVNATGLPAARQLTTARDIATLSRAVVRDYPEFYKVFSQVAVDYEGQTIANHNHLLSTLPGVDGIKTGFTNAAGFTLAASAAHDGVRLIAVVLGSPTRLARDANVTTLLETGFDVLKQRVRGDGPTVAAYLAEPDDLSDHELQTLVETDVTAGDDSQLALLKPPASPRPRRNW